MSADNTWQGVCNYVKGGKGEMYRNKKVCYQFGAGMRYSFV